MAASEGDNSSASVGLNKRKASEFAEETYYKKSANILKQDGRHPMDILPLEVWENVFGNLTTASDLLSCTKVCSSFESFLKQKYKWIVFAEVIKFVFPHLDTHSKLVCRQVCHPLTEVIDNLLHHLKGAPVLRTKLINCDSFHVRIFEDRFNKTKFGFWNPSLWNSISIERMQSHGPAWRLRIFCCLVKRGQYVEKCELTLMQDEDHEPMRLLLEVLTYLPNVKKLIIVAETFGRDRVEKSVCSYCYQLEDKNYKLPPLKYLEQLVMVSVYPCLAQKILNRYRGQLKQYSVYG